MTEPLTSPPITTDDAGDALRLLRRSLQRSRGFALLVCTCDMPAARDRFIANLGTAMPDVELITLDAADPGQDLLENLAAKVTEAHPQAFMVVVADALLAAPSSARSFLDTLNLRRAEWPRRVPHPVAFWLPRRHLGTLTRGAPDFFDWRSDTIDFPEVPDNALRVLGVREWEFGVDPRFSPEERDERLRELKSRIAAIVGATDEAIVRQRLAWWDEVAELKLLRGDVDEALRIREQEQLPVYRRLGDVREIAVCQRKIADILEARGQLDEALRILQQDSLPALEQLGSVRDVAVIRGRIADILYARGQLDEALRIREQEQLPVYRRLGDVREIAVTQGKIADILHARGQLDEALRIREQEELPTLERLGDVRALLVARANLALNLLERAAPGDADKARDLLTLALTDARRLSIPEAGQIEAFLQQHNLQPEA